MQVLTIKNPAFLCLEVEFSGPVVKYVPNDWESTS